MKIRILQPLPETVKFQKATIQHRRMSQRKLQKTNMETDFWILSFPIQLFEKSTKKYRALPKALRRRQIVQQSP